MATMARYACALFVCMLSPCANRSLPDLVQQICPMCLETTPRQHARTTHTRDDSDDGQFVGAKPRIYPPHSTIQHWQLRGMWQGRMDGLCALLTFITWGPQPNQPD